MWGSDRDDRAEDDDGLVVCVLISLCGGCCTECADCSFPECADSPSEELSTQSVSSLVTLNCLGGSGSAGVVAMGSGCDEVVLLVVVVGVS